MDVLSVTDVNPTKSNVRPTLSAAKIGSYGLLANTLTKIRVLWGIDESKKHRYGHDTNEKPVVTDFNSMN